MDTNPQEHHNILLWSVAIVVVIVVLLIVFMGNSGPRGGEDITYSDTTAENPEDRLPEGIPTDLPFELATVDESYSVKNENPPAMQYTVSYRTNKVIGLIHSEYANYAVNNGFETKVSTSDTSYARVYATGGGTESNDDISLVATRQDDGTTLVQLSYVDRE